MADPLTSKWGVTPSDCHLNGLLREKARDVHFKHEEDENFCGWANGRFFSFFRTRLKKCIEPFYFYRNKKFKFVELEKALIKIAIIVLKKNPTIIITKQRN